MATFLLDYADFTTANNGNSINNNHNNNFKKAMITAIFTGHLLCSKPQNCHFVYSSQKCFEIDNYNPYFTGKKLGTKRVTSFARVQQIERNEPSTQIQVSMIFATRFLYNTISDIINMLLEV